jgi:hypothetical protein
MADVESLELQIVGDARSAEQSINALCDTLDRLKKATSGGCGLDAVANGMQKVGKANKSTASTNLHNAMTFGKLATKITATYVTLQRAGNIVASWINESNSYVENVNLFTVAMGEYADAAQEYAEKVGELMGIDPSDWMRNQGVFMTLATGFGVAGDRAAVMSQQLTQLGYDLSSFFNISVEEAMQKVKSGFAGELEPLRNLGYDLSQAKLEAVALSLGIDKSVSSMNQAEKSQLRYHAIMTQVTTAQGDMARTLNAPANQLRILQASITQAARALGNIFIPALNAVLPYAIAFMKIIRWVAEEIAGLFGFEIQEVDYSGISSGIGDISDGMDDATGKAKALRKMLLGIDELNVLPDKSSGGSNSNAGGGSFDFELPTYNFLEGLQDSKISGIFEEWKEKLTPTVNFIKENFDEILSLVKVIGAAILLWKVGSGIANFVTALSNLSAAGTIALTATLAVTGLTIYGQGIKGAFEDGTDGIDFAKILGGGVLGGASVAKLGGVFATWVDSAMAGSAIDTAITGAGINLGVGTAGAAGTALAGAGASVVLGLTAFVTGVWDSVVNGIDWWSAILTALGGAAVGGGAAVIATALGTAIAPGVGTAIGLAVGLLVDGIILAVQKWIIPNWDSIVAWLSNACQTVVQLASDIWQGICDVWTGITEWWETNIWQPLRDFWSGLWDGIATTASDSWEAIKEFFSPAIEWFGELFGSVEQTLNDIFYNIGVIAEGCWLVIETAWGIVSTWFDEKIVQPVSQFFSDLWTGIEENAIAAWENIKGVYEAVSTWIDEKIVQPVSGFFSNLWAGFYEDAKAAWEDVQGVFNDLAAFFEGIFSDAWQGIVDVFSVAGEIFVDIKDGIVAAFKEIVNDIIEGINEAIAVPFRGINRALRSIRDMEILGLKPFSGLITISVPSIPYLAEGGMVNTGQMFVAREAGPELVGTIGNRSAVVNNDQIVESVSQGVYQAVVAAMGQSGGTQVVEAKVNDKVLFEVVVNRNRQETMRTGYSPLLGGV